MSSISWIPSFTFCQAQSLEPLRPVLSVPEVGSPNGWLAKFQNHVPCGNQIFIHLCSLFFSINESNYPPWNWHSPWQIGLPKLKVVSESSIFRYYDVLCMLVFRECKAPTKLRFFEPRPNMEKLPCALRFIYCIYIIYICICVYFCMYIYIPATTVIGDSQFAMIETPLQLQESWAHSLRIAWHCFSNLARCTWRCARTDWIQKKHTGLYGIQTQQYYKHVMPPCSSETMLWVHAFIFHVLAVHVDSTYMPMFPHVSP